MDKRTELQKYSDFEAVNKKAKQLLGTGVQVSTRKDKKYMVINPNGNKIHFGAWGMEDFTKHKDKERRMNFQKRNKKWATASKWSPAFLSYALLW